MKKIALFLFAFFILCTGVQADSVDFFYTFEHHILTLLGTHSGGENHQVTLLVTGGSFDTGEPKIIGIDQVSTGINGGFVVPVVLGVIDDDVEIAMGGTNVNTATRERIHLTSAPLTQEDILNNSVKIGNDIYELNSIHITPDNVADSLKRGGNFMEFKIQNRWFDLLDERAYNAAYFKTENAISGHVVDEWKINKWYRLGREFPMLFN